MYTFDFNIIDMPKGLIGIQISADENVIFTFSADETTAYEMLFWLIDIDCLDANITEFHFNQVKGSFDIVLPLTKFEI